MNPALMLPRRSAADTPSALLGTVTTGTTTSVCYVLVDGATTPVTAVVPAAQQAYCLDPAQIGTRVVGELIGGRFYVTDALTAAGSGSGAGAPVVLTFTFAVASTTWPLPHNLGQRYVEVYLTDAAGNEITGDVKYVDANNAQVTWWFPMTGSAEIKYP